MRFSHNQQVRSMQVMTHLLALVGLYYASLDYLLTSIITFWVIGVLGINIGYHRLISHRSFKTNKYIERFLALVGTITLVGSPVAWVAIHRTHHKHAETEQDPHSPYQLGIFKSWFGLWNIPKLNVRIVSDLRADSFYRFLHKYYLTINAVWCICLALVDPWLVIYAYAIPAVLVLHSTSTIIVIAHKHGYKTYDINDESRNSWIASLVTLGEGWHNNHHAKPRDWNNQHKWWELDPNAWIIRLIKNG